MLIRIGIAVLLLAVIAVGVFFILRMRRKKKEQAEAPPPPPKDPQKAKRLAELRTSLNALVAEELKQLDQNVGGMPGRYSMPWCLVLSEKGAGQSTVLQNTGLHIPFRGASDQLAESAHCRFWFYDKGVAIDLGAEVWQEEEAFVHFCHLLRAARPKRPVDSVLVLVAAETLVGDDKQSEDKIKAQSELLYQRLLRFQQEISLRLPTYVMISKSDTIPGFTAFCGGLSTHQREQLAGWSSPYPLNISYNTTWVDQAFAELYKTQCGLQLDLLASAKLSDKEQDLAFLLPRNTQALRDPMKLYLDQLFRVSVYSESNLLRGVYMCGDATIASAMVQKSEESEGLKHPVFIHDLFAKKLFPESGLAKPLKKGMLNQQRALRLVRVALGASVLVSVLLLWTAYANLSRDVRAVMGFLDKVPVGSTLSVAQDRDRFAQQTQELLSAIGNVANSRLFSVRLPSSWLSSLDDDVQEAMRRSFERVVLGGLYEGLALKAKQVLGLEGDLAAPPPSDEPPPAGEPGSGRPAAAAERLTSRTVQIQSLQNMPEYQELRDLSRAYLEFVQNVDTYNRLGADHHKRFDTVVPLVKYVFGVELQPIFLRNAELYQEALANATSRSFDMGLVNPKVQARARTICKALHRRLFIDNAIAIETEEILAHVSRLKAESEGGGADLPVLTELRDVLLRLERDLGRPELQWMSKDALELGDPMAEVLASLRHFSPDGRMSDELRQEWQQSHQQLRRRLLEVQLPAMGLILVRDNEKHRLAMTQGVVELKANLETFLSLAFVQQNLEKPHAQNSEGSYRVVWNDDLLRQSTAFADAYDAYVRDRLGQMYRHIREVVKSTALERLGQNMPALVGQARREERVLRFSGDVNALQDELSSEVGDLKRVSTVLRQILETYDRLTLKAAHAELYQQLQEDSREILRRIDLLPEREEMYRVSSKLASWRGEKPPVLAAFDVEDADALSQYIKTQRNRIKGWGRDYAKVPVSLLDGLTSGRSDDPLLGKWRNIVNQLEYFERMTPGNSVKEMESFFDTTLITVTPENCLDKLPKQTGDNTDFFLQAKARVHDSVRKRCLVFAAEKILEMYEHLARRFNQDLAGKFPFTRNAQSLDDPDAIPRDIRGFFQEYDEFIRQYDAYVGRRETIGGSGEVGREVNNFLQSLREVRPFFAPLLGDRGDLARYNVSIDYRINKSNEINGQQIAEWGFATGDQKVEDGQGFWQLGDRVRLSMRWAKDGPYVPAPTGQPRGASVDSNDTISFDFAGIWGLVRIIRMFRASPIDLRKSLDRQPHVLKFMVDITERKHTGRVRLLPDSYYTNKGNTPSGAAKMSFLYNKAVVFVRVIINPPESKDLLVIPVDWPTLAPLTRGRNGQ